MKNLILLFLFVSFSCFSQNFLTPENVGYPGYGYADFYIQKAVDSTKNCLLLPHIYPIQNSIYLYDNYWIKGEGATLSYGGNIKMFIPQGNNIRVSDVTLVGGGSGTDQYGFYLSNTSLTNYYNIQLHNIKFKDLITAGVYVYKNIPVNFRNGITAINCISVGCGIAFYMDERAEYNFFSNCHVHEGTIGFKNVGGNNSWVGGSLNYNNIGVLIAGGENDAHSHVSSATINHNNTNVQCDSVVNGYLFCNNNIHVGDIKIFNSPNIYFKGNRTYIDSLIIINSSNCNWSENAFSNKPKFLTPFNMGNNYNE